MAHLTVGLDLGCESIKRVRLRSSFRTVEVVDFIRIPLPDDGRPRLDRIRDALGQLESGVHPADLMAITLPGDEMSVHLLTLPFTDRKKIVQTLRFELESQIPFTLDQVVFDYLSAGATKDGKTHLLVALCQIDRMARWLEVLQQGGIDPRLVGCDNLAYTSLVDNLPPTGDGAAVAVLDVGHCLSSVCIVGPAGAEFARTLTGGGLEITRLMAEAFKVEIPQAEEGKRRGGFVESNQVKASNDEQLKISEAVRRATTPLIRDLRQTLSAHRSLTCRSVGKIWLCGGGSTVSNFDRFLSDELQLEVERIRNDHFDLPGMEHLGEGDAASHAWVKPLGLALHAHQGGRRGWLNLRRGPFAFKGDFKLLQGKLLRVAVASLILVFLAIGYALTRYLSLTSTDQALNQRMEEVTRTIIGKSYDDPDVAISVIQERISPEADPLPRVTALDILREIHARIPKDFKLRLKEINISPKKIRASGFTDSFDSVEKIKAALEEYECFTKIQTGKTRKTRDETEVEFELTIVFGC